MAKVQIWSTNTKMREVKVAMAGREWVLQRQNPYEFPTDWIHDGALGPGMQMQRLQKYYMKTDPDIVLVSCGY